jgi:Transglutaminase-like superfamily
MRPARVTEIEVRDGWAALGKLQELIAADDPMELRRFNRGGRLYPAEIHSFVTDRVRYLHGQVQRWATPTRTLLAGYGDCGNSARAVMSLAKFHGWPSRLRVFTKTDRDPGILGKVTTYPAHVAAEVWDGARWKWAECVVPARFGEHPLAAARRLGLPTTLVEVPVSGRARQLRRPIHGPWPYGGSYPAHVTAIGKTFTRAKAAWPFYKDVRAQYREDVPRGSLHLYVTGRRGAQRWTVTHADAVNPDLGSQVEHLARDVISGIPRASIGAVELDPTPTPVTPQEQYDALYDAWTTVRADVPTGAQLLILLAQWALETGWTAGMAASPSQIQWSVGNVKHTDGDGADWVTYTTQEGSGANVQTLQQSFKAYPDLASATLDYFNRFQPGGPNAGAFASVQSADVQGFAKALKSEGYYTASEASYAAGMQGRLTALEALNLTPPTSGALGTVAGLAVLGLGLTYAYQQGWLAPAVRAFAGFHV